MTSRDVVRTADDRDHRPERLLVHQFAVVRHVVDHGRRKQRALALVAVEQLRALRDRVVDAALEQRRRLSLITVPTSVAGPSDRRP